MQITPQIAVYVLLLLPGLLGHAVFSAFTHTEKPTWSGRTVVAILLSAGAYLPIGALRLWAGLTWLPDPQSLLNAADKGVAATFTSETLLCVALACVLGLIYSVLLVRAHNSRALHRAALRFGLTTKSGYVNEWDSVMIEQARSRWVVVVLKDGASFVGWLKSHDVCSSDRCLVLHKVRQQDTSGNELVWPEHEVLVINSMADVRFLRLVPVQEVIDEQSAVPRVGDQVCELEPKPAAAEPAAIGADAARGITVAVSEVTAPHST